MQMQAVCQYLTDRIESLPKFIIFAHHQNVLNAISQIFSEQRVSGGDLTLPWQPDTVICGVYLLDVWIIIEEEFSIKKTISSAVLSESNI